MHRINCPVSCPPVLVYSPKTQEAIISHPVSGIRIWHPVSGIRCLLSGIWYPVSGIRRKKKRPPDWEAFSAL